MGEDFREGSLSVGTWEETSVPCGGTLPSVLPPIPSRLCPLWGARVVAPGLPGQWQGWHVPILLPPWPLGPDPALKWPGRQHGETSLGCGSHLRCTTGSNRIFGFSAPHQRQTLSLSLSLSLSPACQEALAAGRDGAGLEGAGPAAMGCSDAPIPAGEEIWVISSWLLVSPCPAWAQEGSQHWLLPMAAAAAAPGVETLPCLWALVSCSDCSEVLGSKPPRWHLSSPAHADWCSRTTPNCFSLWVAVCAVGLGG